MKLSFRTAFRAFLGVSACLSVIVTGMRCARNEKPVVNDSYVTTAEKIVASALEEERGYRWLKELTDIGPRPSGSETGLKAIRWAEAKMKELGLENIRLQTVMAPRWERGAVERAEIVSPGRLRGRALNVVALGGTDGTPADGVTAEVVKVNSIEELKTLGTAVTDKIVFFDRPMPAGELDPFVAYFKTYPLRDQGPSEAAKQGAVGAIVRSLSFRKDNIPHTGGTTFEEGVKRIPAVAVGLRDADYLSGLLDGEPGVTVKLQLSARNLPEAETFNVIGELAGERDDEIILLGGHLDSWDKGTGAHDDGGGCMQALEAAELLMRLGIKPRRTIRVVFFANEEFGHDGAQVYSDYATLRDEVLIAAIESDDGSFSPRGFATDTPEAAATMTPWLPYLQKAGIDWIHQGESSSDVQVISSARARVGYKVDGQRYFLYHHNEADIFEAVNPREFELGSAAMSILAYLFSEEG